MGDAGQSTAAPERSLGFAGSVIKGRYRVNALSSVSRDVVVYRAEDVRNGRMVALEVLRDELAGDPAFVAAVRDQARTLANSAHVHRGVARVFDCGAMDTGELFVALERYEGPTLREILDARGALDPSTALRIASQLGEALETLHHNRIIHGQLDPTSVLMVTELPSGAGWQLSRGALAQRRPAPTRSRERNAGLSSAKGKKAAPTSCR